MAHQVSASLPVQTSVSLPAKTSVSLPASRLKALESFFSLESFQMPELSSSLPLKWQPHILSVARQSDEWCCKHLGIIGDGPKKQELREFRMPLFSNLAIPFGSFEQQLACSNICWSLVLLDDPLEVRAKNGVDSSDYLETIMSIARGAMKKGQFAADDKALGALEEATSHLRSLMPGPVYNRFLTENKAWLDSIFTPFEISVPGYIQYRRYGIAIYPLFPLLELCLGICLKEKDLSSVEFTSAARALCDTIWLSNDLYSFPKEHQSRSLDNFLFILLATDPTVHNVQEAVNHTYGMIQQKEEEFKFYRDIVVAKAKESANQDLINFMDGLRYMIPGAILFHSLSSRYFGSGTKLEGDILHGTCNVTDKGIMIDRKKPTPGGRGKYYDLLAI